MELDHSTRDGCLVVAMTGQINLFTAPRIQRVLLKDLAERPYGIVCDLSGVDAIDPVCATVFSTVANHPSSDWPMTSFLLCGARPAVAEVLKRLAVPDFLPVLPTLEAALDQVAARPPYLRDELRLAPTATAPAAARLYVHDASPRLLRLVPDDPEAETGRGLRLVEQLASFWGIHRRPDGGKVVWCTLRLWPRRGPAATSGRR